MNTAPNESQAVNGRAPATTEGTTEIGNFTAFQHSIHDPQYWELDEADAHAVFAPFEQLPPDQRRIPENAYELGLRVAEELGRLRLVAKALALERPPVPTSPPPARGRPRKTQRLTVRANPERATITTLGKRMSVEQARVLGTMLLQAANEVEGVSE